MKKLILLLILSVCLLGSPAKLLAKENEVYEVNLNINNDEIEMIIDSFAPISYLPDSAVYPLVLIKEDMEEALKPNENEKVKWKIIISNKRLKEAYLLYKQNKSEEAAKNIFAYIGALNSIEDSVEKLKTREDMPVPVIDLENSLTTQQKILVFFYNSGLELSSANAIKENIDLIENLTQ